MSKKYLELIEKAREKGLNEEWDECIKYYLEAFRYSYSADDVLDLSLAYLETEQTSISLDIVNAVINEMPEYFRGYFCKGLVYYDLKEYHDALNNFLEALNKIMVDYTNELESELGLVQYYIGKSYDDLGLFVEAENYYLLSLEKCPDYYYANLHLGSLYEKKNILDKAEFYTKKALSINSDVPIVAYNLGVIYGRLEKYDLAKKYYFEELEKNQSFPFAYYNLANIFKDIDKDLPKAKEYYLLALKELKNEINVWYNLGCCYVLMNDFNNATDCFYCATIKNKEILEFMKTDKEIESYVNSEKYQELVDKAS